MPQIRVGTREFEAFPAVTTKKNLRKPSSPQGEVLASPVFHGLRHDYRGAA